MPFGFCRRAAGFGTADDDRGGGVILRREDVAGDPAHVGAELGQRLDQDGRLHRHVQAAHHLRAGERLLRAVARAQRHQAGHLVLGEADFLAAELGEAEILDLVGFAAGLAGRFERVHFLTAAVASALLVHARPEGRAYCELRTVNC